MKEALIREIDAIYRDHNYRLQYVSLEDYSESQLVAHLAKLQAGAYGWMKGKAPSPQPKSPLTPLYKGEEREGDKDHRQDACATNPTEQFGGRGHGRGE